MVTMVVEVMTMTKTMALMLGASMTIVGEGLGGGMGRRGCDRCPGAPVTTPPGDDEG